MGTVEPDYETNRLTDRPPRELVDRIGRAPTPYISDVLSGLGVKNYALRGIERLSGDTERLVGPAVTLLLVPTNGTHAFSEAPFIHTEIIDRAESGDVIVMAAGGAPFAFWGEQMTKRAQDVGIRGGIVDGHARDCDEIRGLGFELFGRGRGFESFVRHYETVAFNIPVPLYGVAVGPGDLIVGDSDGVLVVDRTLIPEVARALDKIDELETWIAEARASGTSASEIMVEVNRVTSNLAEESR